MIYVIVVFLSQMGIEKFLGFNYIVNLIIGIGLTAFSFLLLTKSEKDFVINKAIALKERLIKR